MISKCTVLIIGAGPAGMSAAIQLKRYGINTLILEKAEPGGLLKNAGMVENYPGFPGGIPGIKLVRNMLNHIQALGISIVHDEVIRLSLQDKQFLAKSSKQDIEADYVIIASGTQANMSLLNIDPAISHLISYEVYQLRRLKHKHLVIVGAGDAAFDYALNLADANKVSILNRGDTIKCLPLLRERQKNNPNIRYLHDIRIESIKLSGDGILLNCESSQGKTTMKADHLLYAIGRHAAIDFFDSALKAQMLSGHLPEKIYFAGDVKNGLYRQSAIATGEGIRTAMEIYHTLKNEGNGNNC